MKEANSSLRFYFKSFQWSCSNGQIRENGEGNSDMSLIRLIKLLKTRTPLLRIT